ncbi:MAG: YfhO family protein, partial [Clostridiales bacterium]|nr:YfhO family protein [Clostridiales bacterium]
EGWYAWVDGEKTEVTPINDALMAIKMSAGKHDVRIEYVPAGFKPGVLITCVSIVTIILLAAIPALVRKNRAAKLATASADAQADAEVPAESFEAVEAVAPVTPDEFLEPEEAKPEENKAEAPAENAEPEKAESEPKADETGSQSPSDEPAEPSKENGDGEQ